MTKRKRTLADNSSEALPESSTQPHVNDSKDVGVLDVLPGITRKITACGACRKQKVGVSIRVNFIGQSLTTF